MRKDKNQAFATRVAQANRSELVVILFEIIQECLAEAGEAFATGNQDTFCNELKNARAFLNELMGSLNYEYKISFQLMSLYVYCDRQLAQAMAARSVEPLENIDFILDKLTEAFKGVAKEDYSKPIMMNTETIYAGLTYRPGSLNESVKNDGSHRGFQA